MEVQPLIILGNSATILELGKSKISQIAPGITRDNINIIEKKETATIGIDRIKEVISQASRSTLTGKLKAYIIVEAHRLTEEAQNALLKLLEEPPDDTIFVLTTNNVDLILPTVVSRCQVILEDENRTEKDSFEDISVLLDSDPIERLKEFDKQTDVKELIDKIQKYLQRQLRAYPDDKFQTRACIESLVLVENSRQMVESNVARDAVGESLLLTLPKISRSL